MEDDLPGEPRGQEAATAVELDKKAVFGWSMFDFANSSFTTVMVTAFFSLYFMNEVVPASSDGTDRGPALWGLAVAISQAIVILSAPLLGALADFSGAKKKFLFATYLGCAALTIALGFFAQPGAVALTMALFIGANVCFSSGENFVSAFLPEIAPPHLIGRISGLAWGLGYVGGIGSLLLSVYLLSDAGLGEAGYPWVWVMIGFWFLLAGIPTFLFRQGAASEGADARGADAVDGGLSSTRTHPSRGASLQTAVPLSDHLHDLYLRSHGGDQFREQDCR